MYNRTNNKFKKSCPECKDTDEEHGTFRALLSKHPFSHILSFQGQLTRSVKAKEYVCPHKMAMPFIH